MTDGWITLGVVVSILTAMALNLAGPDLIMLAGVTVLLVCGVIDPSQAFVGFANEGVLTVAALFVVAAGVRETGGLDFFARSVLGQPKGLVAAQSRLMIPVAFMSAFLNNTPVVAMLVPMVSDWSRRIGVPASKLLIPLSYAAILGGMCTLIGTSTNLVVLGMAKASHPELEIGMFDIAWIGLPALLTGLAFLILTSRWLLPNRAQAPASMTDPREYTVAMRVEPNSPIVGKTIEDAGLRNLPGLYLVEIEREGEIIVAVSPHRAVRSGDVLVFAGLVDSVADLRRIRGLVPDADELDKVFKSTDQRRLVEVVIGPASNLVGKNVREAQFRTHFHAAIIAVHRQGERVREKVGDIVMQAGDTLLLEARPNFMRLHRNARTFALVSEVEGSKPPAYDRAWIGGVILVAMVVSNVLGFLPLVTAALLASGLMLVTRCITGPDARRSLDLRVLITIASAFGIAQAMDTSGIAAEIAQTIANVALPMGPAALLVALYVVTALFATVVGNNAAAALMFPVVASAASSAGIDMKAALLVLMVAASASFATPIGYQTNLMVLGPGGYRYTDFFRIGIPLQITVGVVAVAVAQALWL